MSAPRPGAAKEHEGKRSSYYDAAGAQGGLVDILAPKNSCLRPIVELVAVVTVGS